MRLPALLTLIFSLTLLAACGKDTTPAPAPSGGTSTPPAETAAPAPTGDGRPQIAIIPRSGSSESDQAFHAGALKALGEARKGPDGKPIVDLLWQPPKDPAQPASQVDAVRSLIKSGVAVIIIAPDDYATVGDITVAAASHVPLIAVEWDDHTAGFKSQINPDRQAGELAGQTLAKAISRKGRILIVRNPQSPPGPTAIEQGLLDGMEASPDTMPVTIAAIGSFADEASATRAADGLFAKYRNADGTFPFDAIFTSNEGTTLGVATALKDLHQAGKVRLIAVGASAKVVPLLKSGEITGIVLTDPLATGYQSVKTAIDCIKEKKVDKHIDIPLHVATRENMDTPEIAALLNPPIGKYLPH